MDCPTCGKSLSNEQGMRQHHTKVHDEPLPNRTCDGCDSEFYDPKARLAYCDDCDPNVGEHNGNWKEAQERAICEICDSEFSFYPSDKDGRFCTECVEEADGLLPENPAEKIERINTECPNCGETIAVLPSRLERRKRGVFCDNSCYGTWLSEHVVGENHHQWEGGNRNYGKKWWQIRRAALERDNSECQLCEKGTSQIGRKPDVHHLQRVRDFDDPQDAHTLNNVISLCRSCHRCVETGAVDAPLPSDEK